MTLIDEIKSDMNAILKDTTDGLAESITYNTGGGAVAKTAVVTVIDFDPNEDEMGRKVAQVVDFQISTDATDGIALTNIKKPTGHTIVWNGDTYAVQYARGGSKGTFVVRGRRIHDLKRYSRGHRFNREG